MKAEQVMGKINEIKRLAIIGSGRLGQLISHYALIDSRFELVGYFDDFQKPDSYVGLGVILGGTDQIYKFYKRGLFDEILIAVGYNHFNFRKKIFDELKGHIPLAQIFHPSVYIDKSCTIGEGVVILPGCTLDRNVTIEDNVFLNVGCIIGHDSTIQAHSFLSTGVILAGFVNIGQCCFLGAGATIRSKTSMCNYSALGCGAVLIKDTTEQDYYIGVPARSLKQKRALA